MPRYTFKELSSGKVDILENGKSIAQGGPGFDVSYAKTLGYQPIATQVTTTPIATPTAPPTGQAAPQLPEPMAPSAQRAYQTSLTSYADGTRAAYDAMIKQRMESNVADRKALDQQRQALLDETAPQTRPTYAQEQRVNQNQLDAAEAASKTLQTNFEESQKLIGELDALLMEGTALIEEQEKFGGVSFVRDARINETKRDVQARATVIQAVLSARSGQVAQAHNIIRESRSSITALWQDSLDYYGTLLELNQSDSLQLDKEDKDLANEQLASAREAMDNADTTYRMVTDAMLDPDMAQLYADAGVRLTDSPLEVSTKLATVGYQREVAQLSNEMAVKGYTYLAPGQKAPAGSQTVTVTDSKGAQKQYYSKPPANRGTAGEAPTKSGTLVYTAQDKSEDSQALEKSRGQDGYVDPAVYQALYVAWVSSGGTLPDFLKEFPPKSYVNPANKTLPPILRPPTKSDDGFDSF